MAVPARGGREVDLGNPQELWAPRLRPHPFVRAAADALRLNAPSRIKPQSIPSAAWLRWGNFYHQVRWGGRS